MNIDDLETRVKDMTDEELDAYLRELRARRKNTPEKLMSKGPAKKKAATKKDKDELSSLLESMDDDKRAAFDQTMKELGL